MLNQSQQPKLKLGRPARSRRHEALHAARQWLEAGNRAPATPDTAAIDQVFATWKPSQDDPANAPANDPAGPGGATAQIVEQLDQQLRQLDQQRHKLAELLGRAAE